MMRASGISSGFPLLSRSSGQVAHVLRTRSPLSTGASPGFTFDLHVLSAPPAFVLSQDQTLRQDLETTASANRDRVFDLFRVALRELTPSGNFHLDTRSRWQHEVVMIAHHQHWLLASLLCCQGAIPTGAHAGANTSETRSLGVRSAGRAHAREGPELV